MISQRMQGIEAELNTRWLGHPAVILDTVDSSNRWLKDHGARQSGGHGMTVWADRQTAGRGRLGRDWDSPAGQNIYTSVLLRPPKSRLTGILSLLAGVAVVRAAGAGGRVDARVKWPNDGVIGGKKFSGVLVEVGTEPLPWAIIGIGINVLGTPDEKLQHATSLAQEGAGWSREDLWVGLMTELEAVYDAWLVQGDSWVISQWTHQNATLGHRVRVDRPHEIPWTGLAREINADGSLVVIRDGQPISVTAGEVQVRLADGRYASDS